MVLLNKFPSVDSFQLVTVSLRVAVPWSCGESQGWGGGWCSVCALWGGEDSGAPEVQEEGQLQGTQAKCMTLAKTLFLKGRWEGYSVFIQMLGPAGLGKYSISP